MRMGALMTADDDGGDSDQVVFAGPAAGAMCASSTVATPRFEAALNLLREELRATMEVRRTILRDQDLQATHPGHRDDLLIQTLREIQQYTRAIGVLDRMENGELIEEELAAALPPIRPRGMGPERICVLRPASPPEPRPTTSEGRA